MTKRTMQKRIARYEAALAAKEITPREYDGLIEALAKIMARGR